MKIIEIWYYPEYTSKEEVDNDIERKQAIGYAKVIDNELVEIKGVTTKVSYIKSEATINS